MRQRGTKEEKISRKENRPLDRLLAIFLESGDLFFLLRFAEMKAHEKGRNNYYCGKETL
jgi:hypothetical protein